MGAPDEGFDPLDPVEHVAARRRALRGRGAGHHRPGLPRLGRRDQRAAGLERRRALRGRRRVGRRRAARTSCVDRFPDGAAPARDDRGHAGRGRPVAARAVTAPPRRRIYLMRHAQVRYFQGEHPHEVLLTEEGARQAAAAAEALRERHVRPRDHERPARARSRRRARRARTRARGRTARCARSRAASSAASRPTRAGDDDHRVPRRRPARDALPRRRDDRRAASTACCRSSTRCSRTRAGTSLLLVLHGAVNRAILGRALTGDRVVPRRLRAGARLHQRPRRRRATAPAIVRAVGLHAVRPGARRRAARRRRWSTSGRSTSTLAAGKP